MYDIKVEAKEHKAKYGREVMTYINAETYGDIVVSVPRDFKESFECWINQHGSEVSDRLMQDSKEIEWDNLEDYFYDLYIEIVEAELLDNMTEYLTYMAYQYMIEMGRDFITETEQIEIGDFVEVFEPEDSLTELKGLVHHLMSY